MKELTRRQFAKGLAAGAVLAPIVNQRILAGKDRPEICVFSKHLQWLSYEKMAEAAAKIGFSGVDLTVRPGGHVLPENVAKDLPRAVRSVKAAGIDVPMMTTRIVDASNPLTEKILATASENGIRHYRLGSYRYPEEKSIDETLVEIQTKLAGLARLNKKFGIRGQYQNHAGNGRFGAPVWDLANILKELDSEWLGCQFDIRHATLEGGSAWPLDFRVVSKYVQSADIKDFRWQETKGKWTPLNCPLGEGMVDFDRYLKMLKDSGFNGPFSIHYEYPLGGANKGKSELTLPASTVLESMEKDLVFLKKKLALHGIG